MKQESSWKILTFFMGSVIIVIDSKLGEGKAWGAVLVAEFGFLSSAELLLCVFGIYEDKGTSCHFGWCLQVLTMQRSHWENRRTMENEWSLMYHSSSPVSTQALLLANVFCLQNKQAVCWREGISAGELCL